MCGGGGCGTVVGALLGVAAAPFTGGLSLATIGAAASLGGSLGSALFPAKAPAMPALSSPAAPAPTVRASNGATVSIGTDTKNSRVSGSRSGTNSNVSSGDVLSGLGRSGLAI